MQISWASIVTVRLTAWLCVCLGLVCVPLDAGAAAPLAFTLDYRVPDGVVCPDAAAVAAVANREVGRPVVNAGGKRTASLVISKSGDELTARVAFTDTLGAEQAVRLVSATADRCRDLVRVFGLLVALHLQVVENEETSAIAAAAPTKPKVPPPVPRDKPNKMPPPPPPEPELAPPEPAPEPPKPVEIIPPPPSQAPSVKQEPTPPVRAVACWLGPIVRSGIALGPNPGVRFGGGWYWKPSLRFNAELDGVWGGRTQVVSGGAYEVGAGALALSACWSPGAASALQGWLCPALSAGLVRVAGKGLDVSRSDMTLIATAGVDGRLSFPLVGSWIAEFVVSAAFNPRPHAVYIDNSNAWISQPFWFAGAVVVGYRWKARQRSAQRR